MPPAPLYLDTARLGQMSPMAQRLSVAFNRLAVEEPFNLYFEKFLKDGFFSWPERYQRRFPGLSPWGGIGQVQEGLRRLAGAVERTSAVIASRSLSLVKAASQVAFRRCKRLLTTDLSWQTYADELGSEAISVGGQVFAMPVRKKILASEITAEELAQSVADFYVAQQCDSLFLPAIDSFGIRVPIELIVRQIEARRPIQFVLTDAAQALGHVSLREICRCSDLVISGGHKWVRGYYPLGIGLLGRGAKAETTGTQIAFRECLAQIDPLAGFLASLELGQVGRHLETVNLGPLFSCKGALQEFETFDLTAATFAQQQSVSQVQSIALAADCRPKPVHESLSAGIQLIDCQPQSERNATAEDTQRRLMGKGVFATAYDRGMVRISVPHRILCEHELTRLKRGLAAARDSTSHL